MAVRRTGIGAVASRALLLAALAAFTLTACATGEGTTGTGEALAPPPADAPYRDATLAPAARAADLLGYMTLDEKIGQMIQIDRQFLANDAHITEYALGSLLSGGGSVPEPNTPEAWADMIDGYQRRALETRLAIPLLYGVDAVHGHNNLVGATIFPHNVGLGATGNAALVGETARITALEAAAVGVNWSFSPSIAVPQDIRWGRTYEGFSEDAELVAEMGAAYVTGMQGPGGIADPAAGVGQDDRILATLKHFIGDGGTAGGRDQGDVPYPLAEAMERFAEPYRAGLAAGAGSVMATFNSIEGEKVHGSAEVLDGALRGELGFDGLVVSDWAAIRQIPIPPMQQVARAVNAGIDLIMVPDDYVGTRLELKGAVNTGLIPVARIDEAVLRILEVKFALGLFEDPFAPRHLIAEIGSADHRAVARQAVRESVVVLKNEGALLPLAGRFEAPAASDGASGARSAPVILVAGERADDIGAQSGGWTLTWQGFRGNRIPGTTIAAAFSAWAAGDGEVAPIVLFRPRGELAPDDPTPDVVVAVIGENPYAEGQGDSGRLALPPTDMALLRRAASHDAPLVTVLLTGRPVVVPEVFELSDAVAAAWLPGTEGAGVVDVLVGAAPATGTLPFTWPVEPGVLPLQATEPATGVLFPRGFGITYDAVEGALR